MGSGQSVQPLPDHPPPEKLSEFKKLAIDPEHYNIPEIPQKRQCTDKLFLGIFAGCLAVLFVFIIYASCNTHGFQYDNCGNFCGQRNERVEGVNCTGKDYREYKFLQMDELVDFQRWHELDYRDSVRKHCVKECNEEYNLIVDDQCFILEELEIWDELINSTTVIRVRDNIDNKMSMNNAWGFILDSLGWILLVVSISGGLCVLMLVLFRYAPACAIWAIIIMWPFFMWTVTFVLWSDDGHNNDLLVSSNRSRTDMSSKDLAIVMAVLAVIMTVLLARYFRKIPMVINIFREATKAIFSMPLIILESLLTVLALVVTIVMFVVTTNVFCTAGVFTDLGNHFYGYRPTAAVIFGLYFNTAMTLWIINFILACQIFVIASSVATWYFSRDKSFMGSPIRDSLTCLVKFHLGSVAFGSLVLTLLAIVKWILKSLAERKSTRCLVQCFLGIIQSLFAYISENAYVQVAMHGEGFYESGKRAVRLLFKHLNEALPLNFIGWMVLFMAKLLVITFTIILGIILKSDDLVDHNWGTVIFFATVISFLMAHAIFRIFQTAIKTIFLCYCEDRELNDGIDRPFYMSEELKQYFEEFKPINNVAIDHCSDV